MAASEASARIRQELVRWRNEFRAAKGRDPAKDEVPEEHKKMLRQLRDSTNLPRTSGPRGGGGGGGDRGEDSDSHVSGSPVRRDRVLDTIPRRSAGKLPGAQALAAKPKRRRARVLPMSDDDEAEGPAVPEPGPSTPGPSDSKSLTLGSLFTQVVDILEDVPRSGPPRKKQRQSPDDPNNPRPLASYTRRKKPKQNIYRKRFKGSGGYSKGKAKKIITSNFCQVSRGGRQPPRGGGGRGRPGADRAARGRNLDPSMPCWTGTWTQRHRPRRREGWGWRMEERPQLAGRRPPPPSSLRAPRCGTHWHGARRRTK